MISMKPILQNINNAVLTGERAMPMKDITSDNSNSFSLNRMAFSRRGHVDQGSAPEKKWIGGNRDASQVISNRRIKGIANGSLNAPPLYGVSQKMSFTTKNDQNTQRNALHRTRSGGARVPAKVTHKYSNPPIFYD